MLSGLTRHHARGPPGNELSLIVNTGTFDAEYYAYFCMHGVFKRDMLLLTVNTAAIVAKHCG